MRRRDFKPYIFFIFALTGTLFLPDSFTRVLRELSIASIAPPLKAIHGLKTNLFASHVFSQAPSLQNNKKEIENLRLENLRLKEQLKEIKEFLLSEERFEDLKNELAFLDAKLPTSPLLEFYKRREKEALKKLELELSSVPARVVYREPVSWSSFLWVDVGKKLNERLGKEIISNNSPVVIGNSIIGVVEHVGKTQSKIRLITDRSLTPSVRVVRGAEQQRKIAKDLQGLLYQLSLQTNLFFDEEEKEKIFSDLNVLKKRFLSEMHENYYLAKGELHGMSYPLWRLCNQRLKGIGFNFDYSDEEGPARELRSGKILGREKKQGEIALLSVGDLLVTTGLDGIFPSGYNVAMIQNIFPLKEGSYTYELEAIMTGGTLDEIERVWILPPVNQSL